MRRQHRDILNNSAVLYCGGSVTNSRKTTFSRKDALEYKSPMTTLQWKQTSEAQLTDTADDSGTN